MKKNYKVILVVVVAILVVVGAVILLGRETRHESENAENTNETVTTEETEVTDETEVIDETTDSEQSDETTSSETAEDLISFKLADLKQGDEYQIGLVPLGTSWYKLKPWSVSDGYQIISPDEDGEWNYSDVQKFVWSSDECLLEGIRFNAVYEFLHDELVDVKLVFRSEKNAAEQFDPFVAELTRMFGPESEKTEDQQTGGLAYTWQTDNTRLQINLDSLDDTTKDMTISIGYTEKELDRIKAENIKEPRELLLTTFKQDQEYQFEGVAWKSSVEEVEAQLNGNLKNVTTEAPKDYFFYDFADVAYVLNGTEAKASFEFQADELVSVGFGFYDLEDPKAFFEEIVSVFQKEYGNETEMFQNDTKGIISYRWRTENSQLAIGFYEDHDEQIKIFLIPRS